MPAFKLISRFSASDAQQRAVDALTRGVSGGSKFQTLLGVTGSGKTFTMAGVIEKLQRPALVLTHNKTLAAQLYREFSEFFPENAVEYFVSYYDYYQPEAYMASSDLYIEKDASINDEIDRLRLKATSSILDRDDVVVVSSVSCIYGLGTPADFKKRHVRFRAGEEHDRDSFLRDLVGIYYDRNDVAFQRGTFRVRGDIVEIYPAYFSRESYRIEFFGDVIERISLMDTVNGRVKENLRECHIYPAKHFVSSREEMKGVIGLIRGELDERLKVLRLENKLVEAQRLESRTNYDIEMLSEMGYCSGIENYSRIISGRKEGERPACLLDYFEKKFLLLVDESHVSLPQVRGMFAGDRARKQNLVDYGFRLPSALDNRPLFFDEFINVSNEMIFVSATPGDYELSVSGKPVELLVRPTGLLDPEIFVKPAVNQVDDLINEVKKRAAARERTLVTTLTKKMAEDLADYFADSGIRARYLHSEINTLERVEIITELRRGEFDALIGINLLREGLDIPEVSLVAILDADKEGFLRAERSLIQTSGRAARNVNGTVIMYADKVTSSMKAAIDETVRRRKTQEAYNREHGITPETIRKEVLSIIERYNETEKTGVSLVAEIRSSYDLSGKAGLAAYAARLKEEMLSAASELRFEEAALLRDQLGGAEKKLEIMEKMK